MDSTRLSARKKQPGHDRTFTTSETNFVKALSLILTNRAIFSGSSGSALGGISASVRRRLSTTAPPVGSCTSKSRSKAMLAMLKRELQAPHGPVLQDAPDLHADAVSRLLHDLLRESGH